MVDKLINDLDAGTIATNTEIEMQLNAAAASTKALISELLALYDSLTATLTNKTLDADGTGNVITNIGSSEVKSELLTGQTQVTPLGADEILITDASDAGNLKRSLISALPAASDTPWTLDHDADGFALIDLKRAGGLAFLGNEAAAGAIRLVNDDRISWRNAANNGDAGIRMNSGNNLVFDTGFGVLILQNPIEFALTGQDIKGDACGLEYDTGIGSSTHDFQVNNVTEMTLSSTTLNLQTNTLTLGAASDIILATTTGTKIATGTTQLLAFWNATPVVQPGHIADPTGGSVIDVEARTAIDAILADLAELGLQAAS